MVAQDLELMEADHVVRAVHWCLTGVGGGKGVRDSCFVQNVNSSFPMTFIELNLTFLVDW